MISMEFGSVLASCGNGRFIRRTENKKISVILAKRIAALSR